MNQYNQKRLLFNCLLKDFCSDLNIALVHFGYVNSDKFYDGIHFNQEGVKWYVKHLKQILNPILGLKHNSNKVHNEAQPKYWPNNRQEGTGRNNYMYNKNPNFGRNDGYMYNQPTRQNENVRNYNDQMYDWRQDNIYALLSQFLSSYM